LDRVDIAAVGLGNLAKREGYIERQLKRWSEQWERSKTRELPIFEQVRDALMHRLPPASPATIAHGDYRLSNCMMSPEGPVAGVLDWELCTLGEPMADLGGLLGYWYDPNDPDQRGDPQTTSLPGFPSQDEMAALYADRMKVSLERIVYYRAFCQWRLASIGEGVYARYLNGQQGEQGEALDLDSYKNSIPRRLNNAARLLGIATS
jgi:aminoglycoside phosphotransferase (APT) family kinase protein